MTADASSRLARLLSPWMPTPVVEFWAGQFSPLFSTRRVLAEVVERRVEARDTVTLVLKPNSRFQGFRAHMAAEVIGGRDGDQAGRYVEPGGQVCRVGIVGFGEHGSEANFGFRFEGGILTIVPTFHLLTEHKDWPGCAVIRPGAVVMHAAAKLREQEDDHIVSVIVLPKVGHERI